MDFKQIEAFANVVRYKSFSKAADATFLTQPTISAHISTLEKELGMSLLDRKTKNVTPTAQGKVFYRYATAMLNTRSKAVYALQNMSSNLEGVLEIQTSTIPGQYFLPKMLSGFRNTYPNVKFYTEQSDSFQVIENLLAQKGEVGFTGSKIAGNLVYETMFTDEAVLITPNAGRFAKMQRDMVGVGEFIQEPFIWREHGSATRKEFEDALVQRGYGSRGLNVVARMNNMEAIKQAVAEGLGISIVSKMAVGDNQLDSGMRVFSIEGFKDEREFYFAYHKNVSLSPAAEAFKTYVLEKRRK